MNPVLKHSLAASQHGSGCIPGLSSGSISSGTSLSHHFPLVPFSRLPCPFPSFFHVGCQKLSKQLWAKLGFRRGSVQMARGDQSQAAMRSMGSQEDGNPSALGRERGW